MARSKFPAAALNLLTVIEPGAEGIRVCTRLFGSAFNWLENMLKPGGAIFVT